MENDIEKLKSCVTILEREVSILHEKIFQEKKYRLEDSIRVSNLLGEFARRIRNIDIICVVAFAVLVLQGIGHILSMLGR